VLITSVEAMRDLGVRLAARLQVGDIIVLKGNLGAGKTALTQGIGQYLGITDITSPTFVKERFHLSMLMLIVFSAVQSRTLRLMIWI